MTLLEFQQQFSSIFNNSGAENAASEFLKNAAEICLENDRLKAKLSQSEVFCKDMLNRLEQAATELEALKNLERQNADFTNRIAEQQNQNIELQSVNSKLQSKIDSLEKDLQQSIEQLNSAKSDANNMGVKYAQLQSINDKYEQLNILPDYEQLSDKMKDNLSGIFPNISMEGLLSSGVQWSYLKQLYGILSNDIVEDRKQDYEPMYKIVRKLFAIYNLGMKEPYIIIEPEIGTNYNPQEQTIKGFGVDGKVSRVLLFGYKTKTEVKSKAFVEVI